MEKLGDATKSCNGSGVTISRGKPTASYHDELKMGFLPPSVKTHFFQVVQRAKGRRYSKEEACASFALDVNAGKRISVRSYARIFQVPRSTVQDWIPHLIEFVKELIERYTGVDKGPDFINTARNPDTPTVAAVDKQLGKPPVPGRKKRWRRALERVRDRIRTHTLLILKSVVSRAGGNVQNAEFEPISAASYTRDQALTLYEKIGAMPSYPFDLLFVTVQAKAGPIFLPTQLCAKRLDLFRREALRLRT